jgi:hypothetical protein
MSGKKYESRSVHSVSFSLRFSVFLSLSLSLSLRSVAQQPKSGLNRLIVEVSRSRTIRHTHARARAVGLLCTNDQHVAEAATYPTHNRRNTQTFILSEGLEPAIPEIERLQTYAVDRTATGVG